MRTLRALTIIQGLILAAAFGLLIYVVGQNAKEAGAVADANEYLMSHNMVGSLPTACLWRASQGRFTCRATVRSYLTCQPRGFFQSTVNPDRCTLVDIPETR